MILADFKLHPLKGSKFFFRIRIFDTHRRMLRVAKREGSVAPGVTQAAFCGWAYPLRPEPNLGDIFLYVSPTLRQDAVHELTHAAVHYVRDVYRGDLSVPIGSAGASAAEERLCRSLEWLISEFCVRLARFERATSRSFTPGAKRAP